MKSWFLVFCKPNQDPKAEENLLRQGYEIFRPTIKIAKARIGGSRQVRTESMFPRYLFLNIDPSERSILPATWTFGVANIVRFGQEYAKVPEILIDNIRLNMSREIAPLPVAVDFETGDEVLVNGEAFENVEAVYCNPHGKQRSMILLKILNKESKAVIPNEMLSRKAG